MKVQGGKTMDRISLVKVFGLILGLAVLIYGIKGIQATIPTEIATNRRGFDLYVKKNYNTSSRWRVIITQT